MNDLSNHAFSLLENKLIFSLINLFELIETVLLFTSYYDYCFIHLAILNIPHVYWRYVMNIAPIAIIVLYPIKKAAFMWNKIK